jgi:PTS system mannose-specific IIB component
MIIDEGVAKDPFMVKVLKMAAPPGIKVDIYDVEQAVEVLKENDSTNEKIIILVKHPVVIETLLEKGIEIKKLNVGGMGAAPGRKALYKNISISKEEREIFQRILDKGTDIFIQIVPDEKEVDIKKFI